MSKLTVFVSATIVAFFPPLVEASPHAETHLGDDAQESSAAGKSLDENMTISDAPEAPTVLKRSRSARYYPYQQALTFRVGRISDFPKLDFSDSIFGFQYLFPKFLSPKLEAGADLHEGGNGHLHVGWRYIANERSYFRPSAKFGISHFVESKDGLANLAKLENYYLRISGALEYTVYNPYSIRIEPEFAVNFDHIRFLITLGLSRGW